MGQGMDEEFIDAVNTDHVLLMNKSFFIMISITGFIAIGREYERKIDNSGSTRLVSK